MLPAMHLTEANTAIVLDSTADYPEAAEHFPSWRIVPLYVRFGDKSFRDGVDIDADDFYGQLRVAKELPTTSQPTPGDFAAVYGELAGFERILSIHLSSALSGTVASARLAAQDDERVRVIDGGVVSAATAMLAFAIQRRLARGATDDEVDALVDRFRAANRILFTVDSFDCLVRGGRIGKARAFTGDLLNVKPILEIVDGEVRPLKRVRGSQKALQEFVRILDAESEDSPELRIGIAHADAPDRAETLARLVRELRPEAQLELVTGLGSVVGTHAGPGTVGLFWYREEE
jgi:DegV family protein with EDD domain